MLTVIEKAISLEEFEKFLNILEKFTMVWEHIKMTNDRR